MIKTNIKMRVTPEQSAKVQEICFKNEIEWQGGGCDISLTNRPFLFIRTNNRVSYCSNESEFKSNENIEIDPELFIKTNGSCIEKAYKNNFKDYGFEGNFEGEILKEYENHFVGMVYQNEGNFGCSWDKKGKCLQAERFGYADMNLKLIEKEEFTYPMWFKNKHYDIIVRFDKLNQCKVVKSNDKEFPFGLINRLSNHTNTEIWEQVENPNEHLGRLDDIVDEAIKEVSKEDSHNAHYKAQKIDTITRCKANMTLQEQKAICIFNCDKYLHRSKGQDLEDIQKVRYYLNWLEEIEKQLKDK